MVGKQIAHYKILEELGRGGMGVVYKAEDVKLNRLVAIKFLAPELTGATKANDRFINEARAASVLDHPNVGVIHQVERTEDGRLFIVMAYYEGATLKTRIERGPLPVEEAIEISRQVASGLVRAHEAHIIHRDIKPANILITHRGEVKVVDFGLAKLVGQTQLTKSGTTMGTVAYMSPEHVEAKSVDQRTDIWSLGVVLYEMLTGRRPFQGEHDVATMYSIAHEEPEPIHKAIPDAPVGVQRLLEKALSKKPEQRFHSVEELLAELRQLDIKPRFTTRTRFAWHARRLLRKRPFYAWTALVVLILMGTVFVMDRSLSRKPIRITVLPFEAENLETEDQQAAGGLWSTILDDMHKFERLQPLSRDIAGRYSGSDYDASLLRDQFRQDLVLRTVVAKQGTDFQLSAHLTDLQDYAEIWRGECTGALLNLRSLFLANLVEPLRLEGADLEPIDMTKAPTRNPLAYSYHLRGLDILNKNLDLDLALKMFEKAITVDSLFTDAYVSKAIVDYLRYDTGASNDTDFLDEAEFGANEALRLDESSARAKMALGFIYLRKGRVRDSYQLANEALSLKIEDLGGLLLLENVYEFLGLLDRALEQGRQMLAREPLFSSALHKTGIILGMQGKVEEALQMHEQGSEFFPDHIGLHLDRTWDNILLNRVAQARVAWMQAQEIALENFKVRLMEILLLASEGNIDEARAKMTPELMAYGEGQIIEAVWTRQIYALLNDMDSAIQVTEKMIAQGYENYPWLLSDPLLGKLRADPRFKKTMQEMKGRWERYKREIQ